MNCFSCYVHQGAYFWCLIIAIFNFLGIGILWFDYIYLRPQPKEDKNKIDEKLVLALRKAFNVPDPDM